MQFKMQTVYFTILLRRQRVLQMCFAAFVSIYYFARCSVQVVFPDFLSPSVPPPGLIGQQGRPNRENEAQNDKNYASRKGEQ